jgi:hypothetical protein
MPFVSRSHIGLLVVMLTGVVLALQAITFSPRASAAGATVSVGSLSLSVGGQGSLDLRALNMAPPGLGVWTIDVVYDPAVVSVVSCNAMVGGACNPALDSITIRDTGATASGLIGDTTLASITFHCDQTGVSPLTINIVLLADGTIGNPQPINAAIQNGSVTCGPTPTPCGTGGCPTATSTPTATATPTRTPTGTPCPTGKVPSSGGCGTPTPTPTPCPAGTVPFGKGCVQPGQLCYFGGYCVLSGLDFSIGVGTRCDSTAGPMKCTFQTGQTFTLDFKLNSIPAGFSYDGYDFTVYENGVVANPASLVQQGPGVWPPCVIPQSYFGLAGAVQTACGKINAQSSTYVGTLEHIDFQCPNAPATAMITLITLSRQVGNEHTIGTDAVNLFDFISYREAADESLTINCVAAPVGGISLDPASPAVRLETTGASGLDRAGLAGAIAAVTMATLTAAGALWYWRRRASP